MLKTNTIPYAEGFEELKASMTQAAALENNDPLLTNAVNGALVIANTKLAAMLNQIEPLSEETYKDLRTIISGKNLTEILENQEKKLDLMKELFEKNPPESKENPFTLVEKFLEELKEATSLTIADIAKLRNTFLTSKLNSAIQAAAQVPKTSFESGTQASGNNAYYGKVLMRNTDEEPLEKVQ